MGSYAIIGAHLPIACGAAWRAQYKGDKDVTTCFFGDGTTNIGAFHEALNFAAVWKLPVIFVCENNLYMEYTPIADVTAVPSPAGDRASAYGLEKIVIDGNDADVVYREAIKAYDKARSGGGPSLIECLTYRHSGHSRADPAKYRPEGELEKWKERDPIKIYRERLKQFGVSDAQIAKIDADVKKVVDDADRGLQGRAESADGYPHHRRLRRRGLRMAELTYRDAVIRGIAQEMERDNDVVFLGEDVAKAGGVFKATVGPLRAVRAAARARHADLRAGHPRRRDGRGDDWPEADRRDHVLGLLRGVLRLHRQRIPEEPLHDQRADQVPAGGAHRQRRRLALRRAAQLRASRTGA